MAKDKQIKTTEDLSFELAKPFDKSEIKWRPARMLKDGYQETINDFKSLENYIIMCKNNLEEAIKITPLNTDPNPFEWDYNIKQEAKKIWQKVRK